MSVHLQRTSSASFNSSVKDTTQVCTSYCMYMIVIGNSIIALALHFHLLCMHLGKFDCET